MNNHNCERASPPWNKAGPILRAGFTDVPVIGIQTIWINTRARPIAIPANLVLAPLDVEPKTTSRKINVNTVSATKA